MRLCAQIPKFTTAFLFVALVVLAQPTPAESYFHECDGPFTSCTANYWNCSGGWFSCGTGSADAYECDFGWTCSEHGCGSTACVDRSGATHCDRNCRCGLGGDCDGIQF